ncbi:hypothetical protein LWI28_009005 [Acer negundo]|uniref:Uncharacterized protein n=1 Tax=Acer negundo TaxID=4023 RepID=A0AAD5NJ05_ACENE|nr:hypothetical protein LWI28_009005 [Acer negundo]
MANKKESCSASKQSLGHKWKAPGPGTYKIYTDAALDFGKKTSGVGVIIRDWKGNVNGIWIAQLHPIGIQSEQMGIFKSKDLLVCFSSVAHRRSVIFLRSSSIARRLPALINGRVLLKKIASRFSRVVELDLS